ncbi:DinB family protein [Pelolinea submarina]|uniref:DinB family protein n=1 Tax=Pelolinea submarina TaxID=913107 RepID=A0A347ZS76_9CHLR|nr:DinB family protein [Pelolinea submarina]REG11278.1 DinB family protein [Pelolinea submarina]BBB48157.1 hypothetical protein Pelsub_P1385 [Pelolinea submarina]
MLNIINQLKFTRGEFRKGFTGVNEDEGMRRFMPINSISWMVGHLAWHEQLYWLTRLQGYTPIPELNDLASFGGEASQPSLTQMIAYWEQITAEADPFLESLTLADLDPDVVDKTGKKYQINKGTLISRVIYHYWYHTGEMQAVRQLLGHTGLPDFVSDDIETIGKYYLDKEE